MTFPANTLDRAELTEPDGPDPMGPCTGPLLCRVHVGPHSTQAAWCVTIGDADPIPACDYHTDAMAKALGQYGILVTLREIEVLEQVLDDPAPTTWGEALGVDEGPAFYTDLGSEGELREAYGR
jgi:hypothetical protein